MVLRLQMALLSMHQFAILDLFFPMLSSDARSDHSAPQQFDLFNKNKTTEQETGYRTGSTATRTLLTSY